MKQLEDYYRYLDDFKKNNKNKNFKNLLLHAHIVVYHP